MLVTAGALLGSLLNIPLITIDTATIAINVGGAAIPLFVTIGMVARNRVLLPKTLAAIAVVTIAAHMFATPVPGLGITMPFYIAPLTGAAVGLLLARGCRTAPELAYAGGTMGTLLGADILNLANPTVFTSLAGGAATTLSMVGPGYSMVSLSPGYSRSACGYAGRHLR